MYVILTSKPGQFRTEAEEGVEPIESYEYRFCGKPRGRYVIARLTGNPKLMVIDENGPPVVNRVPSKFFPKFADLEAARRELGQLSRPGDDTQLVRL